MDKITLSKRYKFIPQSEIPSHDHVKYKKRAHHIIDVMAHLFLSLFTMFHVTHEVSLCNVKRISNIGALNCSKASPL